MGIARKLTWLWRRLSVMGPAEIVSRVYDQLYLLRLRTRHRPPPAALPPEPPACGRPREFQVARVEFDLERLREDFSMLLEGQLRYGGGDWHFDEGATPWHREHTSLRDWPQSFFNAINYRPGNPVGDARRTWEPARLQQLLPLALRGKDDPLSLSDAESSLALQMIERQLVSWWIHNPVLHGIHYVSAMECGLRCLSLSHIASMLEERGRLSSTVRAIILTTLSQHADFIRKRLSTHSSAGNHTLAECAGLIYASLMLPKRPTSPDDEALAVRLFTQEFDRQVDSDGGGLEQATWYHRFNVELAECVAGTLEANDRSVPDALSSALKRSERFLSALTTDSGDTIRLGDADDGFALSTYHRGHWRTCTLERHVHSFAQHGVTVVRRWGWQLVVQHGPLGMPPSYGHGHADAASVVAFIDGVAVLCDSGTGAYSGECAGHRDHFRGAAAHNTVQVGEQDFARIMGPFMWSEPYRCSLLSVEESDTSIEIAVELTVSRSTQSFQVRRYVRITNHTLTVVDRVVSEPQQAATQRWHVPLALNRRADNEFVSSGPVELTLSMPNENDASVAADEAQVSPAYGELRAITVVSQTVQPSSDDGHDTWLCMSLMRTSTERTEENHHSQKPEALITRAKEFLT